MHNQQQLTKNDCRQRAPAVTITARECIKTRPFIYTPGNQNISILFTTLKSAQTSFLCTGNDG